MHSDVDSMINPSVSSTRAEFFHVLVQDATKAFKKLIKDKTDIDGLPDFALALAAQQVCIAAPLSAALPHRLTFKALDPAAYLWTAHVLCMNMDQAFEVSLSSPRLWHTCWLQAKAEGHEDATPEEGPWLFTLDAPSFQPVLTHVRNRSVSSLLCSP